MGSCGYLFSTRPGVHVLVAMLESAQHNDACYSVECVIDVTHQHVGVGRVWFDPFMGSMSAARPFSTRKCD